MDMFFKKKKVVPIEYDKEKEIPIIHASICTGEKIAGFKNIETNKFREVMLIKNQKDLEDFCNMYQITDTIKTEY